MPRRSASRPGLAAAVLALVVLVLLGRPLLHLRTHAFGPFQILARATALLYVPGAEGPTNVMLADPAVTMLPWAQFAASELRQGRLALWNPYNAAGAPLLANYQSSLLSPFTLPYYVLPLKLALLASAAAKLLATGAFAFLFLRRIRCTLGGALVGAVAFAVSGFSLLMIQHPHSSVLAFLPACLYCVEVLSERCQAAAGERRSPLVPAIGLALALGAAALAGHPEILLFSALVVAAYALWRLFGVARAAREAPGSAGALRAAGLMLAAALLGAALGAVQILPFAEYLANSLVIHVDRGAIARLGRLDWPRHFFPNLAGSPLLPGFSFKSYNYHEAITFFVGGVVLLCAVLGVLRARRGSPARFFAAVVALWIPYAYDLFGVSTWLYAHTPMSHVPIIRSQAMWVPSASFLAALGVSALERGSVRPSARRALASLALAAAVAAPFCAGIDGYLDRLAAILELPRAELPEHIGRHVREMLALFALGASGLAAIAGSPRPAVRAAGYAALISAVLFESAVPLGDYTPTVRDEYVQPRTEAIEALQAEVGGERLVFCGVNKLPAEQNVVYGLRILGSYDVLAIPDTQRVLHHFFGTDFKEFFGREYQENLFERCASKRGLELLGVRYVLTNGEWVPIDTDLGQRRVKPWGDSTYLAYEWRSDLPKPIAYPPRKQSLTFELQATRDGLDGLAVQFEEDAAAAETVVHYRLTDAATGRELVRGERPFGELPLLPGHGRRRELAVRFEREPASKGRELVLEITAPNAEGRARPKVIWAWPSGSVRAKSGAMIDLGYDQADFEPVRRIGPQLLHRYAPSRGRAWIVGSAWRAASHEEAFERITSPAFRPLEEVVLEGLDRPAADHAGPFELEALADEPCRSRFAARCGTPGWLVLSQAFFPGWKARVDGEERELYRANYAFTALELPAGEHEVEIRYAPASLWIGAWVSLAAAACLGAGALCLRRL